ncbi:MAG: ubiquinol-cytochrome c reductase iron-sulfur subunit [Acidobacteriota bacterium]
MRRRQVLSTLGAMASTAIASFLAMPTLVYLFAPRRRESVEGAWIDLGPLEALPQGAPVLVRYAVEVRDGWMNRARPASVWVLRQDDSLHVLNSTCPHLGCAVRWKREDSQFGCPCHASAFAADGRRLSGPAPRALDALPWKVEEGRLLVRHLDYRPGLAEQLPA